MQKQLQKYAIIAIIAWQINRRNYMKHTLKKSFVTILCILTVAMLAALSFALAGCNSQKDGAKVISLVNIELSNEQYAFIFKKDNGALKDSVNSILADKKDEIDGIMDKYLNATSDELLAFGSAEIKTSPTGADDELVVATNVDFAPFEYYNGAKIAGIDIEIAKLIADELGKTLVVVHMDFDAVVTAVQTQAEYDIGMAALTISEDRAQVVDFSDPYYDTTQVIIVKADAITPFDYCTNKAEMESALSALQGAKIGGQVGTTGQQYINGNESLGFGGYPNIAFNAFEAPGLAVQAMLNGNVDYVVVDKAIAVTLLKNFNK